MHKFRQTFYVAIITTLLVGVGGPLMQPTARAQSACNRNTVVFERGFYGQYYNMSEDDPGMQSNINNFNVGIAEENEWFGQSYHAFDRVDRTINFGGNFLPVNTGKRGDPYHFAAHWRSAVVISTPGTYQFNVTSNNDSWLYVNDVLVINLGNAKFTKSGSTNITLTKGVHEISAYFVERSRPLSHYSLTVSGTELRYHPLPPSCTIADARSFGLESLTDSATPPTTNGTPSTGGGRVLGESTVSYTPAVALVKTPDSPDVYAIYANGYRHYISSPKAFTNYGYDFTAIKTISRASLDSYPDARLLRTPEKPNVYFLSTRPNRQWLKIAIPSPTAFVSYPNNYWGNVIVVDALDLAAYPDAVLIKSANQSAVYLLDDNERRLFLSGEVFTELGYSWSEVLTVSKEHLETYVTGPSIG